MIISHPRDGSCFLMEPNELVAAIRFKQGRLWPKGEQRWEAGSGGGGKIMERASFLKMESKPAILLPLVSIREPCGSHVITSRVGLGSGSSW